jgi:acetoacetate decarboxylase
MMPMVGFYGLDLSTQGTDSNENLTAEMTSLVFRTDPKALEPLIPDIFDMPEDPLVNVYHAYLDNHKSLGGGGYALSGVGVHCVYNGPEEKIDGYFDIVLPEDNNKQIILGRESGAPKIFADIPRPEIWTNGTVVSTTAVAGELLYRVQLNGRDGGLRLLSDEEMPAAIEALNSRSLLGYHMTTNLRGEHDIFGTVMPSISSPDKIWVGTDGEIEWGSPKRDFQLEVAMCNTFKNNLPILEVVSTTHWIGKHSFLGTAKVLQKGDQPRR